MEEEYKKEPIIGGGGDDLQLETLPKISKNTFAFYDESKCIMQNLENFGIEYKMQSHKKAYSESLQIIRDESKKESGILDNFLKDNIEWNRNVVNYITEDHENFSDAVPVLLHTNLDIFYKRLELGNTYTQKEYIQKMETMKKAIAKWKLSIIMLAGDWMNNMLATADSHYTMTLTDLSARLNNLQLAKQHSLFNDKSLTQIHSIAGHKFGHVQDDGYGGISNLPVEEYVQTQRDLQKMQRNIEETCQIGTKIKNLSLMSDISIDDVQSILLYCLGDE